MGNKIRKSPKARIELTKEKIEKYNTLTNFSEKEIRQWHKGFHDDCPNGELDRETFVRIFRHSYVNDDRAEAFWNYVITTIRKTNPENKDVDTINFEAFLLMITPSVQGNLEDRLTLAFEMYNVPNRHGNADKVMDEKELTNLVSAMFELANITKYKENRDAKQCAKYIMEKLGGEDKKELTREQFLGAIKGDTEIKCMLAPFYREVSSPASNEPSNNQKEQV